MAVVQLCMMYSRRIQFSCIGLSRAQSRLGAPKEPKIHVDYEIILKMFKNQFKKVSTVSISNDFVQIYPKVLGTSEDQFLEGNECLLYKILGSESFTRWLVGASTRFHAQPRVLVFVSPLPVSAKSNFFQKHLVGVECPYHL